MSGAPREQSVNPTDRGGHALSATPDTYSAQAAAHATEATVTPKDGDWYAPDGSLSSGWSVFSKALNMSVDMEAATEDAARAKAVEHFADCLRRRDPNYVAPAPPSTANVVLGALAGLDPKTASAGDAINAVKAALVEAGATPAKVTPV